MNSIDDALATGRRGLRTHPGTFLLGPTGARLWAGHLDQRPGFAGAIDLVHKLNIPMLFTVTGGDLDRAAPWEAKWRPSHLSVRAETPRLVFTEDKFITWDDCAVSRQSWQNRGDTDIVVRLEVDPQWMDGASGRRYVEQHGFTVVSIVRSDRADLADGIVVGPGETAEFVVAAAVGLGETDTESDLERRLEPMVGAGAAPGAALARHRNDYQEWFDLAPQFTSSDPLFDRTWAYRWFLLRHNLAVPRFGNLDGPLFYEGRAHKMSTTPWSPQGWEFSKLIPLSSPMHLLDVRWYPDPELGAGLWRTLRAAQDDDGLYRSRTVSADFRCYANFIGWASWQYALVHPDTDGAAAMLSSVQAQVRGEQRLLATGGDELPIETQHNRTGKEYQPSYWYFHDFPANPRDPAGFTPLKRVDRACYHYRNAKGAAELARALGRPAESAEFDDLAARVRADVLVKQWDEPTGFFYDLHHETDARAMVRNVVGFYPYWAEMTGPEHLAGLDAAVAAFGTAWPFPSVAPDCPVYSPDGSWQGVHLKGRNGCSWNGPTWPYTNSVVIDGIAATSRRFEHRYDSLVARLLRQYALLHYRDLDGRTPYLVEHYDSTTGEPISDEPDYLHSYFIDLVVRYVAGLDVDAEGIVVDPLDVGLDHFALSGVQVAGHRVDVTFRRDASVDSPHPVGYRVMADGREVLAAPGLLRSRVELPG